VTGVAGFIGSALAERLLAEGHSVRGIDRLSPYYPIALKRRNLERLLGYPGFEFVEEDIATCDLKCLTDDIDAVFHLAAQPGVRVSWGKQFGDYLHDNLLTTQCLLEAVKELPIRRFVYASSSSVYGDATVLPVTEDAPLCPRSPYGVTKVAVESICGAFHAQFGVPTVGLRYFTVFGPGQRPDMAFNRFIDLALRGERLTVFGDGSQRRDFTYVDDAVAATLQAGFSGVPGGIYNIAGGAQASVADVLGMLPQLLDVEVRVDHLDAVPGDVKETFADWSRARSDLGYRAETSLREGLTRQVSWQRAAAAQPA
jgi:nucleoside-diphosphate-sugar epimerase